MSAESLEIAKNLFQTGKIAFESGQYQIAIENLEKASALLTRNTKLGGEVLIWLVTAYEASGRTEEALSLCEQLKRHPHFEINKEARQLHYILKAPKLQRPKEWMTQIPDLATLADNESKTNFVVSTKSSQKPVTKSSEDVDLSQVNTRDNRFIFIALIAIVLILAGLFWLN